MATRNYVLNFNDVAKTGLTLTFQIFNLVANDISISAPTISELSNGFYKFSYDVAPANDDIYYVVSDGGLNILTGVLALSDSYSLTDKTDRLLGLTQENQALDNTTFDSNGNLLTARLRTYSVAGSVGTINDVLATYSVNSTYVGTQLTTYQVARV